MGKYTTQVWISSPPEDVIDAIDTPDTWRVIVPSMQNAEAEDLEAGGYRLDYTYKLGGIRFERAIETVEAESDIEAEPDIQRVFELSGPITGSYTFDITEQGTGTRVKFDTQYAFSNRVLNRITRQFASRYLTRQFDSMLENLKRYLEMEKGKIELGMVES